MAKSRSSGSLLCTENANRWRTIMDVKDFYYDLPQELIAQDPLEDRSSSRLMVLDKITGEVEHRHFKDITEYLRPGNTCKTGKEMQDRNENCFRRRDFDR